MDIEFQLQPREGELGVLHNADATTRENALEYDPDQYTLINVRISTVQWALFENKPAALILFKFILRFRSGSRRIRNFHVNIDFRNQPALSDVNEPMVKRLRPEDTQGRIFTEERGTAISAGVDIPLGPTGTKVHIGDEIARKINREYELKLTGWVKSSAPAVDNVVVWDCEEAKKAARGVVPGYIGAAIVQYSPGHPFIATFNLDAERGIFRFDQNVFEYLNVFAKKDVDDPVIFTPDQAIGHQYPNVTDLKDIDLDELVKLNPIPVLPAGYS